MSNKSITNNHFVRSVRLDHDKIMDFTRYPFNLPAIERLKIVDLECPISFLVGENGTGKSTLLEAIAVAMGFNAEGGTTNFNFKTHDSHSSLHEYLTVVKGAREAQTGFFLRAESFYNCSIRNR